MQVRNVEGLANRNGPESCVETGDRLGEALTGERAGRVLSREKHELLRGAEALGVQRFGDQFKAFAAEGYLTAARTEEVFPRFFLAQQADIRYT